MPDAGGISPIESMGGRRHQDFGDLAYPRGGALSRRRRSAAHSQDRSAQGEPSGGAESWVDGVPQDGDFSPAPVFFGGEQVLIVDDDIRNVFALTSVLEQHGLTVLYAENGREGIEVLDQHDDVSVVLMDIMMPEMDGYATTSAIRRMPQFAGLPIIALTAKAMKGDREKSIDVRCVRLRHQAGGHRPSAVGHGTVDARAVDPGCAARKAGWFHGVSGGGMAIR